MIALDFDNGEYTLAQAINDFCDQVHIIGTTKSHQIAKGNAPACDRFRLVLRLTEPITDVMQYKATITPLVERHSADKASVDGARYFFPCKQIVSIVTEGYTVDPEPPPPKPPPISIEAQKRYGCIKQYEIDAPYPKWVYRFLKFGDLPQYSSDSRNRSVYTVSRKLLSLGFKENDIEQMIWDAPFDKKDFSQGELRKTIRSAARN